MPSKTITCDFFRVEWANNLPELPEATLTEMVQTIVDLEPSKRKVKIGEDYCRLQSMTVSGSDCRGAFVRHDEEEEPLVSNPDADDLHPVQIAPGYLPAHYFCFIYKHEMRTLVVHHNWDAGTYNNLRQYLERLSGHVGLVVSPLITCEGMEAAKKSSRILRANLVFALPPGAAQSYEFDPSVQHIVGTAKGLGCVEFTVGFKGSRAKGGGLDKAKTLAIIELLRKHLTPKKAELSVKATMDDPARLLHLIDHRVHMKKTITCAGKAPTVDEIFAALDGAYQARKGDIKKWKK